MENAAHSDPIYPMFAVGQYDVSQTVPGFRGRGLDDEIMAD